MREATTIVGILQKGPEFIVLLRVLGNGSFVLSEGAGNVIKVLTIK